MSLTNLLHNNMCPLHVGHRIALTLIFSLLAVAPSWATDGNISGSGEKSDPYVIEDADDWNTFAENVLNGTTYAGQFIKLGANISVTKKVGVVNNDGSPVASFSGTFDGDKHTITANITDNNYGTSLFTSISGATIKNLTVAGSIVGGMHAAGIVGFSDGTGNKIDSCIVSATIEGGTHIGGILGHGMYSEFSIENCVFQGKLEGGSKAKGVFVGWGENGGTKSVKNSLYIQQDGQITNKLDLVRMNAGSVTVTDCYKTANVGTYGKLVYLEIPENEILKKWTALDGRTFYIAGDVSISGVNPYYLYTGQEIGLSYNVTNLDGIELVKGTDFTESFTPSPVKDAGDYTLTITAKEDGMYAGSKSVEFSVVDFDGNGEKDSPYVISDEKAWNAFASFVENGDTYSGKFVKLGANISVTKKVGVVENKGTLVAPFSGTFDGDKHTITANITDKNNYGTSLFAYISGATIKNLTLAGSVVGGMHAAGIVGYSEGTGNKIDSCVVTATIDGGNGGTHIGGILGHGLTSDISIENCEFQGKLVGGAIAKGVFFGWGDDGGTKNVKNCLYIQQDNQNTSGLDLVRMDAGSVTVTDCYKTANVGTYGKLVYLEIPENEILKKWTALDGRTFYIAGDVSISGVNPYYFYTGNEIGLSYNVTNFDGIELVKGTDFTEFFAPSPVKDAGDYTLTITAKKDGMYAGSKSVKFSVVDFDGNGEKDSPYVISDEKAWNAFATFVENGDTYSGKFVKLGADISVTKKVGVVKNDGTLVTPFSGTFDGDKHTITVNIHDEDHPGTALFCYINGATIKNLIVEGSVVGKKHAAGLVGTSEGTGNRIENSIVSATVKGFSLIGGILGHGTTSDIDIDNCVFKGKLEGASRAMGVFFGWGDNGGTKTVSNCLYIKDEEQTIDNLDLVKMYDGKVTVVDCYKTANVGTYGELVYLEIPENEILKKWTALDGRTFYIAGGVLISGVNPYYFYTGNVIGLTYKVTDPEGKELVKGTDYTESITPLPVQDAGEYTLTITAKKDGMYAGSKSVNFSVIDFSGDGTESNPYVISEEKDWETFVASVKDGVTYSGKFVKLGANISVTKKVGVVENDGTLVAPFSGTFDGDKHTITVNITDKDNYGTALFAYISGATIKNLTLAGSVVGGMHAAGIVGYSVGTGNKIDSCVVTATIDGGTHIGGILGHGLTSDISIENCEFQGKLVGGEIAKGVFFGWGDEGGTKSVKNCLYIQQDGQNTDNLDLVRMNAGSVTVTDCYKTANVGTYGKLVYLEIPENEILIKKTTLDGQKFYIAGDVLISGVNPYYFYTGNVIGLTYKVTDPEGKELVKGTDYTESFTPSPVNSAGDYTLTITAKKDGMYAGSKSVNFSVVLSGDGTKSNPYVINNEKDWEAFVASVKDGVTYSGKFVKLGADISVTEKVGVVENKGTLVAPFSGTFDGDKHTITANITDKNNYGTSLFAYISGATIKNLTLAGSVVGGMHAAGIVGYSVGTGNKIDSCVVTATIDGGNGGTHVGGILGHGLTSDISIENCEFQGKLLGGAIAKGVFFGWGDEGGTKSVKNCLYIQQDGQNTDNLDLVRMNVGSVTVTDCYKTANVGTYGKLVYLEIPENEIWIEKTASDGQKFYIKAVSISGVKSYYLYTGDELVLPYKVTDFEGKELVKGTDYTEFFIPSSVKEAGDYTLTLTLKENGVYSGKKTISFIVSNGIPVTATTTAMNDNVYRVSSDVTIDDRIVITGDVVLVLDEGKTLTASKGIKVSEGNTLTIEGKGALNAFGMKDAAGIGGGAYEFVGRITISGGTVAAMGGYDAAGIGGGYEGSGGIVTVSGGTVAATGGYGAAGIGDGYCGSVERITISGGTVTATGGDYAAGIGGGGYGSVGTITISGGKVTATGGDYAAGIQGRASGSITLGWTNFDDFIYASNYGNVSSLSFAENKQFYYTENGVNKVASIDDIAGKELHPYIGEHNLENASISGVEPSYTYAGNEISPTFKIMDFNGQEMSKDDYAVSIEKNGVETQAVNTGEYTMVFTGKGNYEGTKKVKFSIVPEVVHRYAAVQVLKDEKGTRAEIDGEYSGTDAVNITEDIENVAVTFNREFTPNSGYATIMLPFDVNATKLTGVRSVIEFDGVKTDKNDNKTVGMRYVWCNATLGEQEELNKHPNCNGYSGELKAYTPYMIEMDSPTLGIKDAVTLKSNSGKIVGDAPVGNWVFRGTLQKKVWPKGTGIINEGRLWAFAAAERSGAKIGEFVQFGGNNWANPFRAYLVECKKTDNGLDCKDDSETQPSPVSRYRFADALAPTNSAEKSAGAAATDQPLVLKQAAASETASLNSMDIVIVYGDKDSEGDKERPTVIGRFNPATGEIRMLPRTKQTYDLKGRRVGNGKKAKGAYYRK